MLAKLTSKNQLTLPKSVTDQLGPVQYFEVQLQAGQVVLTPVRIQRGDAVRAKLAELELGEDVVAQAMAFAAKAARPGKVASKAVVAKKPALKVAPKVAQKVARKVASKAARKTVRTTA